MLSCDVQLVIFYSMRSLFDNCSCKLLGWKVSTASCVSLAFLSLISLVGSMKFNFKFLIYFSLFDFRIFFFWLAVIMKIEPVLLKWRNGQSGFWRFLYLTMR